MHVYILNAVTIFFLLSNLLQILDVVFLLPVSVFISANITDLVKCRILWHFIRVCTVCKSIPLEHNGLPVIKLISSRTIVKSTLDIVVHIYLS